MGKNRSRKYYFQSTVQINLIFFTVLVDLYYNRDHAQSIHIHFLFQLHAQLYYSSEAVLVLNRKRTGADTEERQEPITAACPTHQISRRRINLPNRGSK